jgi:hypothetical protein
MNLLLLRCGYSIVIISNENRQRYIESLMQGQQLQNWEPFRDLVTEANQAALMEIWASWQPPQMLRAKHCRSIRRCLTFCRSDSFDFC